jgi:hypothetical protein
MKSFVATIALTLVVTMPQRTRQPNEQPEPVNDRDSYAIYAMLIKLHYPRPIPEQIVVQQETETSGLCVPKQSDQQRADPEWLQVEINFKQANSRVRLLRDALPFDLPYRFISRAELKADDARLQAIHPGLWERLPESMEYAAVSAVGFNQTRTKALVYIRFRSKGFTYPMELRDGKWDVAKNGFACSWIA